MSKWQPLATDQFELLRMTAKTNAFTDGPPFSEYRLIAHVRPYLNNSSTTLNQVSSSLPGHDQHLFRLRVRCWIQNFYAGLAPVFGQRNNVNELVKKIIDTVVRGYADNLTQ